MIEKDRCWRNRKAWELLVAEVTVLVDTCPPPTYHTKYALQKILCKNPKYLRVLNTKRIYSRLLTKYNTVLFFQCLQCCKADLWKQWRNRKIIKYKKYMGLFQLLFFKLFLKVVSKTENIYTIVNSLYNNWESVCLNVRSLMLNKHIYTYQVSRRGC